MMHTNPFQGKRFSQGWTLQDQEYVEKEEKKLFPKMNAETNKQIDIIYHAAALALFRYHGWTNEQINDLIANVSQSIWDECKGNNQMSMLQMLDEETGIELMNDTTNQHWYEVIYLNSALDDGRSLSPFAWVRMRQKQLTWIPAQITACILMSLYRKEGWKVDSLGKLFQQLEDIKHEYHLDGDLIRQVCDEETNFCIVPSDYVEREV